MPMPCALNCCNGPGSNLSGAYSFPMAGRSKKTRARRCETWQARWRDRRLPEHGLCQPISRRGPCFVLGVVDGLALMHEPAVRSENNEVPLLVLQIALGTDLQRRTVRFSCHFGLLMA